MKECKNNMCDLKNQTYPEWILEDQEQKGIAFFCYENEKEERGIEKIKVEDITYKETIEKGEDSVAFKFLPYGIEIEHNNKKMIVEKGMWD